MNLNEPGTKTPVSAKGASPGGKAPAGPGAPRPGAKKGEKAGPELPGMGRRVKPKERVVVQDDGEGNWLVSYGDMMTLLFAFFVIISAFSTPDASKMEKLKEATAKSMGVEYVKPFEDLTVALKNILKQTALDKEVALQDTGDGVAIIANGTLFFDSGSAELKSQAAELVNNLSNILVQEAKGFRIIVEGHTDNVPMSSKMFPSNWELSSARAGTVVRLLETKGIGREFLRPQGLADTEPLVPNTDANGASLAENRAQNRRIVIRVQRQLPKRMESNATTKAGGA